MSRLHIDWTRCDGHGGCVELLPQVLAGDRWGFPLPRDGQRDPELPVGSLRAAEHAVRSCPLMALRIL